MNKNFATAVATVTTMAANCSRSREATAATKSVEASQSRKAPDQTPDWTGPDRTGRDRTGPDRIGSLPPLPLLMPPLLMLTLPPPLLERPFDVTEGRHNNQQ